MVGLRVFGILGTKDKMLCPTYISLRQPNTCKNVVLDNKQDTFFYKMLLLLNFKGRYWETLWGSRDMTHGNSILIPRARGKTFEATASLSSPHLTAVACGIAPTTASLAWSCRVDVRGFVVGLNASLTRLDNRAA